MARLIEVHALEPYRIAVRFDDGASGEIDLAELAGKGVFTSWKDPATFAKVMIDPTTGTASWPGGIELDSDRLHHDVTGAPLPGSTAVTR